MSRLPSISEGQLSGAETDVCREEHQGPVPPGSGLRPPASTPIHPFCPPGLRPERVLPCFASTGPSGGTDVPTQPSFLTLPFVFAC